MPSYRKEVPLGYSTNFVEGKIKHALNTAGFLRMNNGLCLLYITVAIRRQGVWPPKSNYNSLLRKVLEGMLVNEANLIRLLSN